MASRILKHIKQLVNTREDTGPLYGGALSQLPRIDDAYLIIEDNEIAGYGKMSSLDKDHVQLPAAQEDCRGKLVLPCWCDSHTHLVFAGSRENEFVDRISGLSYAEIHARGGGILNTVRKVNETSEDELFQISWNRLQEVAALGTGAIEIKSGYGLTVDDELKMLRVIRKLAQRSSLSIRSTFLGAHTYPAAYRENHKAYIELIIRDMLPVIAKEKLADYIDVFCEKGFFSQQETETILRAGIGYGLKPKLHCNQLNSIGGIETGIKLDALSLDHLEAISEEDSRQLRNRNWKGLCTLLPTSAFFLGMPMPNARKLIDAGCAVALASDYNPGSSPSGNMNLVVSMGCLQMNLSPEEAVNAATINGAFAMGLGETCGSISIGKQANLIISLPIPSLAFMPYAFGANHIDKVMVRGEYLG